MKSDADIYVEMACAVVTHAFASDATVDDIRSWWIDEAERRALYELDQSHIDLILDACREAALKLPEHQPVKPKRKPFKKGGG